MIYNGLRSILARGLGSRAAFFVDIFPSRDAWQGKLVRVEHGAGAGAAGESSAYWAAMVRTPVAGMVAMTGWPALMVASGSAVRKALPVV